MKLFISTLLLYLIFIGYIPLKSQNLFLVIEGDTSNISLYDSVKISEWRNDFLNDQVKEGRVFIGVDSINETNQGIFYSIFLGPKYKYAFTFEENSTIKRNRYKNDPHKFIIQALDHMSDHGYPFSKITVDSIFQKDEIISLKMNIQKGPLIVYDTLSLLSEIPVNVETIWLSLGINPGKVYSQKTYGKISTQLNQLPYLSLNSEPDISFSNGLAKVYLDLDYIRVSSFDGIVGFLPNQSSDRQLLITGFVNFNLHNMFNSGKNMQVNWNRYESESQSLKLNYTHPNVFKTDINLNLGSSFLKQDTSFINLFFLGGISKRFLSVNNIGFDYRYESSEQIGGAGENAVIPYNFNWYGIYLNTNSNIIDRPLNFMNYYVGITVGTKKFKESINSFQKDLGPGNAFRGQAMISYQRMISKKSAIYQKIDGIWIQNKRLVYNELNRLGGLMSMRGFNENEFFVNISLVNQFEYRFFFENLSYLKILADQSYLVNQLTAQNLFLYSFGGGMTLDTGNGVFTLIFANGSRKNQFVNENIKIHFGYSTYF